MGQLADARARVAQAAAEEEQSNVKMGMAEKELKTLEVRCKDFEREATDSRKKIQATKADVESFRAKVASCNWDAHREKAGDDLLKENTARVRALSEVGLSLKLEFSPQCDSCSNEKE